MNRVNQMKKFMIYMVLSLLLLTAPAAFATSPAVDFNTYENAASRYSVQYPTEWAALSADTLGPLIQQFAGENGSMFSPDTLEGFPADMSMDVAGISVFLDANGSNFSVIPFTFPTTSGTREAYDTLAAQVASAYQQTLGGVTLVDSGSVYAANGAEFIKVRVEYAADGLAMVITTFFQFQDNRMFQISFTWLATGESDVQALDQIMDTVISSFSAA